MANSIEVLWKLILDKGGAKEGENLIDRLSDALKDMGKDGVKAIDDITKALEKQKKQLQENNNESKKTGFGDAAGKVGGLSNKFRGVGQLAGIDTNLVGDIADAVEGISGLGTVITGSLLPALSGAAAALLPLAPILLPLAAAAVAVGAAVGQAVSDIDKHLAQLEEELNARRSAVEAAFAGTTVDEAKAQVQEYNNTIAAQNFLLKDNIKQRDDAFRKEQQQQEQALGIFGVFGDLIARLAVLLGKSEVNKFDDQVKTSQESLDKATAGAKEWQQAIDEGLFKTGEAKKQEEDLAAARNQSSDATKQAEQAAKDQQRIAEKAAADQQREVEKQQQAQEQAEQKRLAAAQQYSDKLVDIAQSAADNAEKSLSNLRQTVADNQTGFFQDIHDISTDFHDSEREEEIARREEEANDLRQHANELQKIRDTAASEEKDLERKRDFLGATRVRENAIAQQEAEIKAFREGQDEKIRAQKSEDAAQLRELDKARRERFQMLMRANDQAKQAYQRDIENQRTARHIAERDARSNRDRQMRDERSFAGSLIGIKRQTAQTELSLAQQTLNGIRGMTTINNSTISNRTLNGGVNIGINGAGIPPTMIRSTVLGVLGEVGIV